MQYDILFLVNVHTCPQFPTLGDIYTHNIITPRRQYTYVYTNIAMYLGKLHTITNLIIVE